MMDITIDTSFDFLTETPPGKDADAASPTLKSYHRRRHLLWPDLIDDAGRRARE